MISASMKSSVLALVLALGVTAVFGGAAMIRREAAEVSTSGSSALGFEHAFEEAAASIRPAVVSITSTRFANAGALRSGQVPQGFEPFLRPGRPGKSQGLGSGVIIDEAGYIVTNNHVIADADTLSVRLWDDRTYEAEVVGTDPKTDLAVIRIDASDLETAAFGSSDALRVGQWVMAVGSPFGLSQTVTTGIVSAKGRQSIGLAEFEDFIQTDASINRGNSGGALIDLQGRLVGINTAIASRGGGHEGIGFAIPIDMAHEIMASLIDHGQVTRGWIGIAIQDLNSELASTFGFESTDGVLVSDILDTGPAADSDLRRGDIITAVNGEPVANRTELRHRVARMGPDHHVELRIVRDGNVMTVAFTLGTMPDDSRTVSTRPESGSGLGLYLSDLNDAVRRRLGVDGDVIGAVVTRVNPDSASADAGVRVGDVIVSVQGEEVAGVAAFRRVVQTFSDEAPLRLRVVRGGAHRYLLVKPQP